MRKILWLLAASQVGLLVAKLLGAIHCSWWLVFVPSFLAVPIGLAVVVALIVVLDDFHFFE